MSIPWRRATDRRRLVPLQSRDPGLGASPDQSLPLLIVVFNNRKYRAMQENHTEYYPDGVAASSGIFYGTHITAPTILSSAVRLISAAGASARRAN